MFVTMLLKGLLVRLEAMWFHFSAKEERTAASQQAISSQAWDEEDSFSESEPPSPFRNAVYQNSTTSGPNYGASFIHPRLTQDSPMPCVPGRSGVTFHHQKVKDQDGATRWFQWCRTEILAAPMQCPRLEKYDLFIHLWAGEVVRMWIWMGGYWESISYGETHPSSDPVWVGRRLMVTPSLRPSWVKPSTWKRGDSARKKARLMTRM
ncbi:hypothetical protein BV25DRAFT_362879 [Artomyces pyxidatus]|uniref:Uncharacterized protein n=1 Tax=Artomyces pyxidatus TaxID=48021 RepID=A0ACB8T6N1_9AGAM|nr:hypothetical protein BV25DRAFT_362879 [Artomyces pyxidatus]